MLALPGLGADEWELVSRHLSFEDSMRLAAAHEDTAPVVRARLDPLVTDAGRALLRLEKALVRCAGPGPDVGEYVEVVHAFEAAKATRQALSAQRARWTPGLPPLALLPDDAPYSNDEAARWLASVRALLETLPEELGADVRVVRTPSASAGGGGGSGGRACWSLRADSFAAPEFWLEMEIWRCDGEWTVYHMAGRVGEQRARLQCSVPSQPGQGASDQPAAGQGAVVSVTCEANPAFLLEFRLL